MFINSLQRVNLNSNINMSNTKAAYENQMNSIFSAETNQAEEIQKDLSPENKERVEKATKLVEECSNTLANNGVDEYCEELKRSKFPLLAILSGTFKNEYKSIMQEASSVFGSIPLDNSAEISDNQLDDFMNKINEIITRAKNLSSKASKTVQIDRKLNEFVAKGGDINKIDMQKLNTDIIKSLDVSNTQEKGFKDDDIVENNDSEIDKKIDSFIKILSSSDSKKISKTRHDYIKEDNNAEGAFVNPFKNTKNPFLT